MRYIFLYIFLLVAKLLPAQVPIDCEKDLPKQLDKGWLFAEGWSPVWIAKDFTGAGMLPVEPFREVTRLPMVNTNKLYTLFLSFSLTCNTPRPLSLCIEQSGATRIYLDGQLLQVYGNIDSISHDVQGYNPQNQPIELPALGAGNHKLVVQYAFQHGLNLRPMINTTMPLFRAQVFDRQAAIFYFSDRHGVSLDFLKIGLTMMLFLIHFIGFIFYPAARVQLLFSGYAFFACIGFFVLFSQHNAYSIADKIALNKLFMLCAGLSNFFLIGVLSMLLAPVNRGWIVLLVVATSAEPVNTLFGNDPYRNIVSILIAMISPIALAWLSYIRMRQGVPAARYLFWGAVVFFVFWILFLLSYQLPSTGLLKDILFHLAAFTFSITISMVLSQNFRFINIDLENKVREVHVLSQEKHDLLERQNEELEVQVKNRTSALARSLEDLRAAQNQLIQSEKMASLGELTAGIAHEIQNPLNFVNNFSEINNDLIDELQQEANKGNYDEVKSIAQDIKQNEQKITHHGKRADAIVKGMLQHSRTSTGIKEPTNINALADEYLRLSYHGLRARDKTFNATMIKEFDESIPPINIIPPDIGRVVLNLLNNAFYAAAGVSLPDHKPTIWLTTKNCTDHIELSIRDNGAGIPEKIRDKIFQPFFTTKPTGEGTGLGLSLSYDIIKAHGGEISVKSTEGEGTTFVILLPFSDI